MARAWPRRQIPSHAANICCCLKPSHPLFVGFTRTNNGVRHGKRSATRRRCSSGAGCAHRPLGRCHDSVRNDVPGGRLSLTPQRILKPASTRRRRRCAVGALWVLALPGRRPPAEQEGCRPVLQRFLQQCPQPWPASACPSSWQAAPLAVWQTEAELPTEQRRQGSAPILALHPARSLGRP